MATLKPNYINLNRMYPASIYAQPSLSPLVLGVNGQVGMAQRQNKAMYDYTIKQMAMSSFSVNSQEYMRRIREEYGITDTGMYDVMGAIGGTIGAGMGAFVGSGLWRGFRKPNTPMTLKFWEGWQGWQTPNVMPSRHQAIIAQNKFNKFTTTHKTEIDNYNKAVDELNKVKKSLDKDQLTYFDNNKKINDLTKEKDALNKMFPNKDNTIKERIKAIDEDITKLKDANSKIKLPDDDISKTALTNVTKMQDAVDSVGDVLKTTAGVTDDIVDAVSTGAKIGAHIGKIIPYVGMVGDVASIGMNVAGLYNNIKDWNNMNPLQAIASTVLYGAGALLDVGALALDIIGIVPGADYEIPNAIGMILSIASAGIGAINGAIIGNTAGHSLSPEGAIAQGLFTSNLVQSFMSRPLTSLATALTMGLFPVGLQSLASIRPKGLRFISKPAEFLTQSAAGNYLRSGISMYTVQGVQALTTKVEDKTAELLNIAPDETDDVNFVSAFSLWGDINDNLFGATARKATLLGLAKNDPHAQTEALARAWGYSNDDTYYSPMFADVVEAFTEEHDIKLAPVVNSLIGVLGEVLIDPQNWNEIQAGNIKAQTGTSLATTTYKFLRLIEVIDFSKGGLKENTTVFKDLFNKLLYKYESYDDNGVKKYRIAKTINSKGEEVYVKTVLGNLSEGARKTYLSRLANAYLYEGAEGVRKILLELEMSAQYKNKHFYDETIEPLTDTVMLMFDVIMNKGVYNYNGTEINISKLSPKDVMPKKLKPKDALDLYMYLNKTYNTVGQDTNKLLSKFIEDFNLRLTDGQLHKIYAMTSDINLDMSLIDTAGEATVWVTSPYQKLIGKGVSHLVRILSERSRYKDTKQKQKQTVTLKELNTTLKDDIKNARNHTDVVQKELNIINSNVTNVMKKRDNPKNDLEDVIKDTIQSDTISTEISDAIKEAQKIQEAIKEQRDELNKVHKDSYYKNYTYTNNGKSITITIKGKKDADKAVKFVKEFEENLNETQLKQKIKEYSSGTDEQREIVTRYQGTKEALEDYIYHSEYLNLLTDSLSLIDTTITMFDQASLTMMEQLTSVTAGLRALQSYTTSSEYLRNDEYYKYRLRKLKEHKQSVEDNIDTLEKQRNELKEKQEAIIKDATEGASLEKVKTDEIVETIKKENEDYKKYQTGIDSINKKLEKENTTLDKCNTSIASITTSLKDYNENYEEYFQKFQELKERSNNKEELSKKDKEELNALYKLLFHHNEKGKIQIKKDYFYEDAKDPDYLKNEEESLKAIYNGINSVVPLFKDSNIRIENIREGISNLQLKFKYNLTDIFHGVFNSILGRDINNSIYSVPRDEYHQTAYKELFANKDGSFITIEDFKNMSSTKKYEFIRKFIGLIESNLDDTDIRLLFIELDKDPVTIRRIYNMLDSAINSLDSSGTQYRQLTSLSVEDLQRYVIQQMYKESSNVNGIIKAAIAQQQKLWETLSKSLKEIDESDPLSYIVRTSIQNHISRYSVALSKTVAGQFLRAYHMPHYIDPERNTYKQYDIFVAPGASRKLINSSTFEYNKTREQKTKNIRKFMESDITQFIINDIEKSVTEKQQNQIDDYNKELQKLDRTTPISKGAEKTSDDQYTVEELNKKRKNIHDAICAIHANIYEEEVKKTVEDQRTYKNSAEEVKDEIRKNPLLENIKEETVLINNYLHANTPEQRKEILIALLTRPEYFNTRDAKTSGAYFEVKETIYNIKKEDDTKHKSFSKYLASKNKKAPAHRRTFENFILMLMQHDDLKICIERKGKIYNVDVKHKFYNYIDELYDAYLHKDNKRLIVHIDYNKTTVKGSVLSSMNNKMNYVFLNTLYKKTYAYLRDNNIELEDTSIEGVKQYLFDLIKDDNKADVLKTIYDSAIELFSTTFIHDNTVTNIRRLNRHINQLHKFEKDTIDNMKSVKLESAIDVTRRIIEQDKDTLKLFEDLMVLDKDDYTAQTYVGKFLQVFSEHLIEDYTRKRTFSFKDFTYFNGKFIRNGKSYTVFDLVYHYRLDENIFNEFINYVLKHSTIELSGDVIAEIQQSLINEYRDVYKEYGEFISANVFTLSKEAFIKEYGEDKLDIYEKLKDNTSLINLLSLFRTKHDISKEHTDKKEYKVLERFGDNNRFKQDYKPVYSEIYEEALNAPKEDNSSLSSIYLKKAIEYVKAEKMSEKDFVHLLKNVLFRGAQIPVGPLLQERITDKIKQINNYAEDIKNQAESPNAHVNITRWKHYIISRHKQIINVYKQRLSIFNSYNEILNKDDLVKLEQTIDTLETITDADDIIKYYTENKYTETAPTINYEGLANYLIANPTKAIKMFENKTKYSKGYVVAKHNNEYVVYPHLHVKNIATTEIPNEHEHIIEDFFGYPAEENYVKKGVSKDEALQTYLKNKRSRLIKEFKNNINKGELTVVPNYDKKKAIVVVSDEDLVETIKDKLNVRDALKAQVSTIQDVIILSGTQYEKLLDMYVSMEADTDYHYEVVPPKPKPGDLKQETSTVDESLIVDTLINVSATQSINSYLEDLNRIHEYIIDTKVDTNKFYEELYTIKNLDNEYNIIRESDTAPTTFFNSEIYRQLKQDSESTVAYYKLRRALKEKGVTDDYGIELIITHYFNLLNSKNDIEYLKVPNNDLELIKNLDVQIKNESLRDIIINAINTVRNEMHPHNVSYSKIGTSDYLQKISHIVNIISKFITTDEKLSYKAMKTLREFNKLNEHHIPSNYYINETYEVIGVLKNLLTDIDIKNFTGVENTVDAQESIKYKLKEIHKYYGNHRKYIQKRNAGYKYGTIRAKSVKNIRTQWKDISKQEVITREDLNKLFPKDANLGRELFDATINNLFDTIKDATERTNFIKTILNPYIQNLGTAYDDTYGPKYNIDFDIDFEPMVKVVNGVPKLNMELVLKPVLTYVKDTGNKDHKKYFYLNDTFRYKDLDKNKDEITKSVKDKMLADTLLDTMEYLVMYPTRATKKTDTFIESQDDTVFTLNVYEQMYTKIAENQKEHKDEFTQGVKKYFEWVRTSTKLSYEAWLKLHDQENTLKIPELLAKEDELRTLAYRERSSKSKYKNIYQSNEAILDNVNIRIYDDDEEAYKTFTNYYNMNRKFFSAENGFNAGRSNYIRNNIKTYAHLLEYCKEFLSIKNYFNLVMFVNKAKYIYMNDKNKKDSLSKIWFKDRLYAERRAKEIATLKKTNTFKDAVSKIYRPANTIKDALTFTESINNTLSRVILDDTEGPTQYSYLKSDSIIKKQNDVELLRTQTQHYITSPLFSKEDNIQSYTTQELQELRMVENVHIYDAMLEQYANSIDQVGSNSAVYHDIRKYFDDIMKIYLTIIEGEDTRTASNFVKIYQITTALRAFGADAKLGGYYRHVFEQGVEENQNPKLIEAIQKCSNYFSNKNYLINITPENIKAIIGYIWFNNIEARQTDTDKLNEFYKQQWEVIDKVRALKNSSVIHNIQSIINDPNNTNKLRDFSLIVYGKDLSKARTKKDKALAREIEKMLRLGDVKDALEHINRYDTYEVAFMKHLKETDFATEQIRNVKDLEKLLEDKLTLQKTLRARHKNKEGYYELLNKKKLKDTDLGIFSFAMEQFNISNEEDMLKHLANKDNINIFENKIKEEDSNLKDTYYKERIKAITEFLHTHPSIINMYLNKIQEYLSKNLQDAEKELTDFLGKATETTIKAYENFYERESFYRSDEGKLFSAIKKNNKVLTEELIAQASLVLPEDTDINEWYKAQEEKASSFIAKVPLEYTAKKATTTDEEDLIVKYKNQSKQYKTYFYYKSEYERIKNNLNKNIALKDILLGKSEYLTDAEKFITDNDTLILFEKYYKDDHVRFTETKIDPLSNFYLKVFNFFMHDVKKEYREENKKDTDGFINSFINYADSKYETTITKTTSKKAIKKISPFYNSLRKLQKMASIQKVMDGDKILKFFDGRKVSYDIELLELKIDLLREHYQKKLEEVSNEPEKVKAYKYYLETIDKHWERIKLSYRFIDFITNPNVNVIKRDDTVLQKSSDKVSNMLKEYYNVELDLESDINDDVYVMLDNEWDKLYNKNTVYTDDRDKLSDKRSLLSWWKSNQESIENYTEFNEEVMARDIEDLKAQLDETRANVKGVVSDNVKRNKNSNINVFKEYYIGDNKVTDEEALNKLESLLLDKKYGMFKNKEELNKHILKAGKRELHNPVIDCLVTMFNYMHQQPEQKEFTVVDIETIKVNDKHSPYQITLIHMNYDNGKWVPTILTSYFNNSAFYDYIQGEDGSKQYTGDLKLFSKQQAEIWGLDENSEEFKAKFDNLVKQVQSTKNSINIVNTFYTMLKEPHPIVAHNGNRFDFPKLEEFFETIGTRMLTNLWYNQLQDFDLSEILQRTVDNSNDIEDYTQFIKSDVHRTEFMKVLRDYNEDYYNQTKQKAAPYNRNTNYKQGDVVIYKDELYIFKEEHLSGQRWNKNKVNHVDYKTVGTIREADTLIKLSDIVMSSLVEEHITRRLKEAIEEAGYKSDESIINSIKYDEDSTTQRLLTNIGKLIGSIDRDANDTDGLLTNTIYSILTASYTSKHAITNIERKQIEQLISTVISSVQTKYNDIVEKGETFEIKENWFTKAKKELMNNIYKKLKINPKEQREYNIKDSMDIVRQRIEQIDEAIGLLSTYSVEDYNKYLEGKKEEINKYQEKLNQIKDERTKAVSNITGLSEDREKALESMNTITKVISKELKVMHDFALKHYKYYADKIKNKVIDQDIDINNIKYQYETYKNQVEDSLELLNKLIRYATTHKGNVETSETDHDNIVKEFLNKTTLTGNVLLQYNKEQLKVHLIELKNKRDNYDKHLNLIDGKTIDEITLRKIIEDSKDFIVTNSESYIKSYMQELKSLIEDLGNPKELKKLIGYIDNNQYDEVIKNIKLISEFVRDKNLDYFKRSTIGLVKRSSHYTKYINLINDKNILVDNYIKYLTRGEDNSLLQIFKDAIKQEQTKIDNTKSLIEFVLAKNEVMPSLDTDLIIDQVYQQTLNGLYKTKNNQELMYSTVLRSYITDDSVQSTTDDIDTFIKYASTETKIGDQPYTKKDARENNNTKIFILRDDKLFMNIDEVNQLVRIIVYDEEHFTAQVFTAPIDEDRTIKFNDGSFSFTYDFSTKGRQLYKTQSNSAYYKIKDLVHKSDEELLKLLTGDESKLLNGLNYGYVHRPTGDHSLNSITKLVKAVKNLSSKVINVDSTNLRDKHNIVTNYNVSLKNDLKVTNLTDIIYQKTIEYHDAISHIYSHGKIHDRISIMKSIAKQYERKLVGSLEPGNITPVMPEEFSRPTFTFTTQDLIDMDIQPYDASEGSMGRVFRRRDNYTLDPEYTLFTNPVRSVLSSKVRYQLFTPIGMINDMKDYVKDGKLTIPSDEEINKQVEEHYKNKIKEELKHIEDETKRNNKYSKILSALQSEEKERFKKFKKLFDADSDLFTPRVANERTHRAYNNGTIQMTGVNAEVLFIDIPDCFEDVIVIDEDYARMMGWDEANKTWLSGQGFKGAVIYKKGINEKFGAYFLASNTSVKERGSQGTHIEQMFNNLLDYYKDPTHHWFNKNQRDLADTLEPKFKEWFAENKNWSKVNKISKDPNIDYESIISEILGNNMKYLELVKRSIKPTKNEKGIEIKPTTLINYYSTKTHQQEEREVEITGTGYFGKMYVMMDAEHTAEDMVTRARVSSDGVLTYVQETVQGSVHKGPLWSNTVIQAARQSVGDAIADALFDVKREAKTKLFIKLQTSGFEQILDDKLNELNIDKEQLTNADKVELIKEFKSMLPQQLLQDMQSYINLHIILKEEKEKKTDKNSTLIKYYEEDIYKLNLKVKNDATRVMSGNEGIIYSDVFDRHIGVRHQLAANLTINMGEARMPMSSLEYSQKNKPNWLCYNLLSDTDVNKIQNNINEQEKKLKGLNENHAKYRHAKELITKYEEQIRTINKTKNDIIKFKAMSQQTNKDRLELVRQLLANGYLERGENEHINYKLVNPIYEKHNGENVLVYVEAIKIKDIMQSAYAYVAAVRSPVQDYNATPILKVTGFVTHAAMECNAYLYGIIGGDNDGDTAAFTLINRDYVECDTNGKRGILANLNSTREEFYDKDYIENVNDGGYHIDFKTNNVKKSNVEYEGIDFRYSYMGKKTTTKGTRGGHPHYTFEEIFSTVFTEKELKNIFDSLKTNIDISKELSNLAFWINVHIRKTTKGNNFEYDKEDKQEATYVKEVNGKWELRSDRRKEDGYTKLYNTKEYLQYYYEQHKDEINTMIKHELALRNLYDNNKLYKHIAERLDTSVVNVQQRITQKAVSDTLQRGAYSKSCIDFMGSRRKYQIAASTLSIFVNMNKDHTGRNWTEYYGIVNPAQLDVQQLLNAIYTKDAIDKYTKMDIKELEELIEKLESLDLEDEEFTINKLYELIPSNDLNKIKARDNFYKADYILACRMTLENLYASRIAETELKDIKVLLKKDGATYEDACKFLKTTYRYAHDYIFKTYYEQWLKQKEQILEKVDKEILIAAWFGRYRKDYNAFIDNKKSAKELAQGYLEQTIITRPTSKAINDLAQNPISMSKHGALGLDISARKKAYINEVAAITELNAKRRINIGIGLEGRMGFAMGMEYNAINNNNIRYHETKEWSIQRRNRLKDLHKTYSHTTKNDVIKNINHEIKLDFYHEMFNNPYVPDTVVNKLYETFKTFVTECNTYLDITNKIKNKNYTKLVECINIFNDYNIPFYRISKHVVNSFTLANLEISEWNTKHPDKYISVIKDKELEHIHFSLGLFELTNYLKQDEYKNAFAFLFRDIPMNDRITIYDFFFDLNSRNLEYNQESGKELVNKDYSLNEDLLENQPKTIDYLENLYGAQIPSYIKNPNLFSEKMNDELYAYLNLERSQETYTLYSLIEDVQQKFLQYKNMLKSCSKYISKAQDIKIETTRDRIIDEIWDEIYNYNKIATQRKELNIQQNVYKKLQKRIEEIQKEVVEYNKQILSVQSTIDKANVYLQYDKTITPEKLKEDLLKDKQEQEEQLKRLKKSALTSAFYNSLEESYKDKTSGEEFELKRIYNLLVNKNNQTLKDAYTRPDTDNYLPKELTQKDIDTFRATRFKQYEGLQVPFLAYADYYKIKNNEGNYEINWSDMFKDYKANSRYHRLTIVLMPFEEETLVKNISAFIHSTSKDKDTRKQLKDIMDKWLEGVDISKEKIPEFMFDNKVRQLIGDIDPKQFITPTLKEIEIHSAKDLETIFNNITNGTWKNLAIGFVSLDDTMTAMENSYYAYTMRGKVNKVLLALQRTEKWMLRFSSGFLLRNAVDTFNQLMSELYQQKGMLGLVNPKNTLGILHQTSKVYDMYKYLSEEKMYTMIDIDNNYIDLQNILSKYTQDMQITDAQDTKCIEEIYSNIIKYLKAYIDVANSNNANSRMELRKSRAEIILKHINNSKLVFEKTKQVKAISLIHFKDTVVFLNNITFSEYYTLFDSFYINSKDTRKSLSRVQRIKESLDTEQENFKNVLFEISAFMQTNAQVDYLRGETAEIKQQVMDNHKQLEITTHEYTYEEIKQQINNAKKEHVKEIGMFTRVGKATTKLYNACNERIENIARIASYLYGKTVFGYSFDKTVETSLRQWFNYGQQSPLEKQLMFDIPYISFPVRSVLNWNERLMNPRFYRLMDDIIDGVYGQYADEDGQYSNWEKFMIQQGWVPIANGLGIRFGTGVFDIQNLLGNTTESIKQRYSPVLRGLSKFIESGKLTEAIGELAVSNLVTRTAKSALPIQAQQNLGISKQQRKTLASSSSMFFEYDENEYTKYTPHKYRNNARWKYYENIYKDWFNKYGRMRKPTVDPVTLVNNIQWKQFLRWKQNQIRRR